ncbi:MAG: hypothetical protein JJV92_03000 [Desulfosarcina sp.]|nr:hypothetical protein [Desulfobacterales bacterium]
MARKIGTIKSFLFLWMKHEKRYCSIFYEALQQLEINEDQRNNEDAISEALCPVLREVCFKDEREIKTPDWEKPIQPAITDELKGGKINKRPDFTCNFLNSLAVSPETYEIPFHVECKRLGKTAGSPTLNRKYITNGINRFDCKTHEYGKRATSGMMIGYIINMEQTAILEAVNKYMPDERLELKFDFTQKVVSCEQNLNRKHVKPAGFKIIHLWTDLRN